MLRSVPIGSLRSRFMALQEHPDHARANSDGVFVWLIVIALTLAVLLIAGRYGSFVPT
jgi:hypothetical protein